MASGSKYTPSLPAEQRDSQHQRQDGVSFGLAATVFEHLPTRFE
jgi:hypothetical protein